MQGLNKALAFTNFNFAYLIFKEDILMSKYVYPAVFTEEKDGKYSITFPDVKGCYTCSDSIQDGIEIAGDALSLMLYDLEQDKKEIPEASNIKDIEVSDNEFASYIIADTGFYERYYSNKTVKKNCTIPYWIEKEASEKNINFSQVLQDALKEIIKKA